MRQIDIGKVVIKFYLPSGGVSTQTWAGTLDLIKRGTGRRATEDGVVEGLLQEFSQDGYIKSLGEYFPFHAVKKIEVFRSPYYVEVNP